MQEMMRAFPGIPIGLSDHTITNSACIAAITLGACVVERHFVDSKERLGPDIVCSMDERECNELIIAARDIPKMLGGEKEAAPEEQVTSNFAFATVVTINPIKTGETFTRENVWVKRPGTGEIPAEDFEKILGKVSKQDIDCDTQLSRNMIEDPLL